MKIIPIALSTHKATRQTTQAYGLRITRPDGTVFGFTSHDQNSVPMGGITYSASPGLNISQVAVSAGFAVGNLELVAAHDETIFTLAAIRGRIWSNSKFLIFRYNWASTANEIEPILAGTMGELTIKKKSVVAELRDLRQYWQQEVGDVTSITCRYRLGSIDEFNGGWCLKDISAAPWTMPFTVTSTPAPTQQVFRDSARLEAEDFFGEGYVIWLTGLNAGQRMKVKSYAADGTFTLALPMPSVIGIGDTGTCVVGCRKRWEEDCKTKFNNLLNFGGEKDAPGLDAITSSATVDA